MKPSGGLSAAIELIVAEVVTRELSLPGMMRHLKREIVAGALSKHNGNVSAAARRLRIHRNTVARIAEGG